MKGDFKIFEMFLLQSFKDNNFSHFIRMCHDLIHIHVYGLYHLGKNVQFLTGFSYAKIRLLKW